MTKRKPLSLFDASSTDEVCALERDHFDAGNFTIMSDGQDVTIWLRRGNAKIVIPADVFRELIRKMQEPQKAAEG